MQRFVPIAVLGLLGLSRLAAAEELTVNQDTWQLRISTTGNIVGLADVNHRQLVQAAAGDNYVRVAVVPAGRAAGEPPKEEVIVCDSPVKVDRKAVGAAFEYDLAPRVPLRLRYEVTFSKRGGFPVLKRVVNLVPTAPPLKQDVMLMVGNNIALPGRKHPVFTPRQNGIGEIVDAEPGRQWSWRLNGEALVREGANDALAIPLVSEALDDSGPRITHVADPFFTTCFQVANGPAARNGEFNCVYTGGRVPLSEPEERTFWTVIQSGGPDKAITSWYATALFDVPEGPDWLHDVALQHYDYLSHGGKGWFEDIDAMAGLMPANERSKVVFTLHGWYDMLGRYGFNEKTGTLDDEWVAFPRAAEMKGKNFPTSESVKMTKADMHRRIRYARDKGFRVCVYFADGMTACDGAGFNKAEEMLAPGGWVGPDTVGEPYMQNPAHPAVYARYLNYLKALLAEYGGEIDALVWDETFHVKAGTISAGAKPAYAARAMMRLVRDCTKLVSTTRPKCALLVSDCQGATFDNKSRWLDVPPYAIVAHGCYQDSHCEPSTWPYGIFANLRNVLWSCNWQAVTHLDYTAFGVEHYRVPVATSNGWLDDKGISRLSEAERDAMMTLFEKRKSQRQELHWLGGPAPEFNAGTPGQPDDVGRHGAAAGE